MDFLEIVSGLFFLIAADEFISQLEIMPLSDYLCHLQLQEGFFLSVQSYYEVLWSITIVQCNT